MTPNNYHVIFSSKPGVNNPPSVDNFAYEECAYPCIRENEVIVKTMYLSVDPALRCRMNDSTGVDYMLPWQIGHTVDGFGGIGTVIKSLSSEFKSGDLVYNSGGFWPWKLYFSTDTMSPEPSALKLDKVDENLIGSQPSLVLSCFGVAGLTAILGVREMGHVTAGANETFVVSGAAGACGSLAGQIAKLEGCSRVIGICGSQAKCDFLTSEVKFDGAINYKSQNVKEKLKELCPSGVDVYFDNVGGDISNTVIKQMNCNGHVILCGQIAVYNTDLPYPPPLSSEIELTLKQKNITRDRFLVLNYPEKFKSNITQLAQWLQTGQLKAHETMEVGLENAGKAFVSMMSGGNIGKQLVHVIDES